MPEGSQANNDSSYGESSESPTFFSLPFLNENTDGWGPNNAPEKYKDLPYQKFSKSDKIGKVGHYHLVFFF
jgi:translation initiation factor 3 subunit D